MDFWYDPLPWYLTPLKLPAALFRRIARARRERYERTSRGTAAGKPPVIVVGNTVVGGSGKSPLVHALATYFQGKGYRIAVISRGYGGNSAIWPHIVDEHSTAREVGDEAIMHHRRGLPVVCDPDRKAAYEVANAAFSPDIVISDDGLQHFNLAREVEIAVLDAERGFGNGHFLPAGPLREDRACFDKVTIRVLTTTDRDKHQHLARQLNAYLSCIEPKDAYQGANAKRIDVKELNKKPVWVAAAIGHPQRMASTLEQWQVKVAKLQSFRDHAQIPIDFLRRHQNVNWVISEKDAARMNDELPQNIFVFRIDAVLDKAFYNAVEQRLNHRPGELRAEG